MYNGQVKINEKEDVVKFQYKNRIFISYNPDCHIVNKINETLCEKINFLKSGD